MSGRKNAKLKMLKLKMLKLKMLKLKMSRKPPFLGNDTFWHYWHKQ